MRFFRPFLLVLLTVWLTLPLAAPAQSTPPAACHDGSSTPGLTAAGEGCRHQTLPSGMAACCHFYATAPHANVGGAVLAAASAVQVGHERGGQPQFIPPVTTRPPPA